RTKLLAAGLAVLLVAAGLAVYLVRSSRSSTTTLDLASRTAAPAGITPQTFAPAGHGATAMVPSTWATSPPSPGFQYVVRGLSPPGRSWTGSPRPLLSTTEAHRLRSMAGCDGDGHRGVVDGDGDDEPDDRHGDRPQDGALYPLPLFLRAATIGHVFLRFRIRSG